MHNIDPRYFVGTAMHEAGVTNEIDTEVATQSDPTGFVSIGLYQISQEEGQEFGISPVDLLDLQKATDCMVQLAEKHRSDMRAFMAALPANSPGFLDASEPDPSYIDTNGTLWPAGTMRAYLALCHNQGFGAAQYTIKTHGMDWRGYKSRNPQINLVCHDYGDDVITGGSAWPQPLPTPSWPPTRILQLTVPPMRGPDVEGLQQRLKVSVDGVHGQGTDAALRQFQYSQGLTADGKCGPQTVAKLPLTV
jgi:hypothetical protein